MATLITPISRSKIEQDSRFTWVSFKRKYAGLVGQFWGQNNNQLKKLKSKGLHVTNDTAAIDHLRRTGYYRLSGYLYAFRERSGEYCPLPPVNASKKFKKGQKTRDVYSTFRNNSSFDDAVKLYIFDKTLRLLVLDALERIEVAIRGEVCHLLGEKDRFAYMDPDNFFPQWSKTIDPKSGLTQHHKWLSRHAELINRSKEECIQHNKVKYGFPLPIWVACEVWDFGVLSNLFAGLTEIDQDKIAIKYGVKNGRTFSYWIKCLNYLRNVCAHHSRLWNRNIVESPEFTPPGLIEWMDKFREPNIQDHCKARTFLLLCIIQHLMYTINPKSQWRKRIKEHLLVPFPNIQHLGLNLYGMGCPDGWETWALWTDAQ